MCYSNNLKDVPDINSKEFKKFLEDYGFDDIVRKSIKDDPTPDQPKKESIGNILFGIISDWCLEHSGLSLAIFLGGSTLICYKITVAMLSQAIFKANLKTSKYFDKPAS